MNLSKTTPSQETNGQNEQNQEVTVTLKLVQIYVTDNKGNPVTDLTKEDFELQDNGKSQEITDFEKHDLLIAHTRATRVQKDLLAPNLMNRKFFFFFDFAFNNVGGVDMAKKAALHFIDTQLTPTDDVAVLSFSTHKGLTIHEYLTGDHAKVREIVKKIGVSEALGRAGRLMEELESERNSGIGGGPARQALLKAAREDFIRIGGKVQWKHEAQAFATGARDMAKAFRYIPGTKHIILFSIGIPDFLIYPRASSIKAELNKVNIASSDSAYLRSRYERMAKELRASNCPVFTVNVEGIYSSFMQREGETFVSEAITKPDQPSSGIAARDRRGVASLRNLADETGGRYFDNMNNYKNIVEEIHNLTSCYYVLGYPIEEKWNGKYHKIKIRVKRPGCKVFGQSGYFNPKLYKNYSDLEKELHLVDLALNDRSHFREPVHFPVITLPFSVGKESKALILAKLNSERTAEILRGGSEIAFIAFNEKKDIVGFRKVKIDHVKRPQNNIFCSADIPLEPGTYDCRVVIRNAANGRGAVASSLINIPTTPEMGLRFYPPLLLIPEKGTVYLDADSVEREEGKGDYSTLWNIYPIDSTQYSPLAGERLMNTARLLVLTHCSVFGISSPWEIKISAHLIHSPTQKRIPLRITSESSSHTNGVISFIELHPNELSPGRYYVYIFAEEMNTGSRSSINTTFVVE